MDWSEERYVRIYTRDTADLLAFGWEGRLVWYELIRKADRAGVIDTGGDLDVLPEMLRVPPDVFTVGFPRITKRGSAVVTDTAIVIPNHVPAQEAKQSDAARQRESRSRRREIAIAGLAVTKRDNRSRDDLETAEIGPGNGRGGGHRAGHETSNEGRTVTKRDAMESRNVTPATEMSPPMSPDVTPSLALPFLAEPKKTTSCPSPGAPDEPKPEPPEALKLADRLGASIRARGGTRETALFRFDKTRIAWAKQLRLMHTADGYSWAEIESVLAWSQRDAFWQANILSATKFRAQFDQLKAQMARPKVNGRPAPAEPPIYREE